MTRLMLLGQVVALAAESSVKDVILTRTRLQMVAIVLGRVVVLVVEGGVPRTSVHHLRLTVHHVPRHRAVRTVRPTGTCVWGKHYQDISFCSLGGEGRRENIHTIHTNKLC